MKKEFITLSILSSSLILFYFLFPVLQENIFKREINVNKKENLYSDQKPQTLQKLNKVKKSKKKFWLTMIIFKKLSLLRKKVK